MKIVLATGGTGGHIFPALQVALEFKKENHQIYFIGSFGDFSPRLKEHGFEIYDIPARGVSFRSPDAAWMSVCSMVKAITHSWRIMRNLKPDAVAGFGGYGAFPVISVGILLGIPSLIHEQNVYPGRANKMLARFVKKIAISFKETKQYLPPGKCVLTGCPCKKPKNYIKEEVLKNFGLQQNKYTILVLGGSQGSHRINDLFKEAVPVIKSLLNFQVIHIAGRKDFDQLNSFYQTSGIDYFLTPFTDEIDKAYSVADLAISRAGAVSVTELATFNLPSILIPYPFAGAHQKQNALILEHAGLGSVFDEKDLSAELLKDSIIDFSRKRFTKEPTSEIIKEIIERNAAYNIASEIKQLC